VTIAGHGVSNPHFRFGIVAHKNGSRATANDAKVLDVTRHRAVGTDNAVFADADIWQNDCAETYESIVADLDRGWLRGNPFSNLAWVIYVSKWMNSVNDAAVSGNAHIIADYDL